MKNINLLQSIMKKNKKILMVGCNFRFYPPIQKIKQLISSMCRDSFIFKKNKKIVISDFIDVTICLLVADKKKENKEMCKKLIDQVNF